MYEKIVEWLYLNDRKFGSARQWREEFLKFVKELEKTPAEEYKCRVHIPFVSQFLDKPDAADFTADLTDSMLGQGLKDLLDKKTTDDLGTLWRMPGKELTLLRLFAINKNGNKYQDLLTGKYIRLSEDMDKKLVKVDEFNF